MVQNVEHFGAKLKLERLANRKIAMHSEIPLSCAKPPKKISWRIALPKGVSSVRINGRICKRRRVKRFLAGVLGTVEIKRLSRNEIGPRVSRKPTIKREKI